MLPPQLWGAQAPRLLVSAPSPKRTLFPSFQLLTPNFCAARALVQRTADPNPRPVQHMGINHGGADVPLPREIAPQSVLEITFVPSSFEVVLTLSSVAPIEAAFPV